MVDTLKIFRRRKTFLTLIFLYHKKLRNYKLQKKPIADHWVDHLSVKIHTADISGAGTNGDIYLGIGGREFCIDSKVPLKEESIEHLNYVIRLPARLQFLNSDDHSALGPYKVTKKNLQIKRLLKKFTTCSFEVNLPTILLQVI